MFQELVPLTLIGMTNVQNQRFDCLLDFTNASIIIKLVQVILKNHRHVGPIIEKKKKKISMSM